ncbi:MAG: RHS repeat-associated core domain-containing protein [Phocaeicola sp.]|nr:RHS repeat-associated core domain-containing protein [Phocaeicola sp.]
MLTYIRFIFSLLLCLLSTLLHSAETARFEYDALGRRTLKETHDVCHRYAWDGNVLLHEWDYSPDEKPQVLTDDLGRTSYDRKEPYKNLVTWVYDGNSYTPVAKLTEEDSYTIVQDYMGTPIQALDSKGEVVWDCILDIYGDVLELRGKRDFIPFRFQGQYEDGETGLYYNRFRYYDPNTGTYISQDPIGLQGGMQLYAYVHDSNSWIDPLGLRKYIVYQAYELDAKGNRTGKIYTGRTSGDDNMSVDQILNRRHTNHHRNLERLNAVYETDNYKAMRGGEQYYIEEARKSGNAADQINGISPKKANKKGYEAAFADPENNKTGKLGDNLKKGCN